MSEWISVKDRLPQLCERVLINELSVGVISAYRETETEFRCDSMWSESIERITHWMPLPEPPTDDKNLVLMTFEESPEYDNGFKQGFISGLEQGRRLIEIARKKELNPSSEDTLGFRLAVEWIDRLFINHIQKCRDN